MLRTSKMFLNTSEKTRVRVVSMCRLIIWQRNILVMELFTLAGSVCRNSVG